MARLPPLHHPRGFQCNQIQAKLGERMLHPHLTPSLPIDLTACAQGSRSLRTLTSKFLTSRPITRCRKSALIQLLQFYQNNKGKPSSAAAHAFEPNDLPPCFSGLDHRLRAVSLHYHLPSASFRLAACVPSLSQWQPGHSPPVSVCKPATPPFQAYPAGASGRPNGFDNRPRNCARKQFRVTPRGCAEKARAARARPVFAQH